jgi:hypothetical protein
MRLTSFLCPPGRYETEEEKQQLLPVLRDISRQEYLKKREDAKLVRAHTAAQM